MEKIFRRFEAGEDIPVAGILRKRKLVKYYNREAMAAVLLAEEFLRGKEIPSDIPFYYASAEMENIDGIKKILSGIREDSFDVSSVLPFVSTTEEFKMMRNMVPCFIAIEHSLTGDNNVIIDSASALLYCALTAPVSGPVLIGGGKFFADGSVECGFALARPGEWKDHPLLGSEACAIEIFKDSGCR